LHRKAAILTLALVILYGLLVAFLVDSVASGLIATILCIPFTLAYALAYAFGDGIIYFTIAIEAFFLWLFLYYILKSWVPR